MTEQAFITIAKQLRERAMNICGTFRLCDMEAEDVAQDALLKLWGIREDIRSVQHAEGLLVTIVRHALIDRARERKHVSLTELPVHLADSSYTQPSDNLEEKDNEEWLTQKLKTLPSTQYQVVRLCQVERKSNADIAAILGFTPRSVATLLSRARHQLLEAIRKRG